MEARIAKLEAQMEAVARDTSILTGEMKDVLVRLRAVEVKIDHLPSKGFIVSVVTGALALFGSLSFFSDQIKAAFGG